MMNRITSYLLKSAFVAAVFFAMSSQSDAFWFNGYWYGPTYRPAYYTAYRPVYYSTYRPIYTAAACNSCGVGCTTCRVGCAPCSVGCAPCGCSPCQCSACGDGCNVSNNSSEPVPETTGIAPPTVRAPTLATTPAPLDLDERVVISRASPTRQRVQVEANYRVPSVARLDVEPAQQSAWQPVADADVYVVSR